jgi:hypothetical protein
MADNAAKKVPKERAATLAEFSSSVIDASQLLVFRETLERIDALLADDDEARMIVEGFRDGRDADIRRGRPWREDGGLVRGFAMVRVAPSLPERAIARPHSGQKRLGTASAASYERRTAWRPENRRWWSR